MKATTTTAPFERSHGKAPRGNGSWAFQRSTTREAFMRDLTGDVDWFPGTFTEARKAAEQAHADSPFTACMG